MSETVLDSASIGTQGTLSAVAHKSKDSDMLYLTVSGDGSSTNLDFEVTGAATQRTDTVVETAFSSTSIGVDASATDQLIRLTGLRGVVGVEVTVTNNAASSTTITVEQVD